MIKRKYFLLVAFLIMIIFLAGCGGTIVPTINNDEAKIESVIEEYFMALDNQNWSKAKNCCVYGSELYDATCDFEADLNTLEILCGYVTINASVNVIDISISGNYAYVICDGSISLSACGVTESNSEYVYAELNKTGNTWKIF
jgi:uncharacterized lipoprotein YehR (DUF1307 family)